MPVAKLDPKISAALKGAPTTHPEQHQVVGPLVQRLVDLGWSLEQMIFGKKEYLAPKSPSEASKREKGRSYAGFPVDIAVFDDPKHIGDYRHLVLAPCDAAEAVSLTQLAHLSPSTSPGPAG